MKLTVISVLLVLLAPFTLALAFNAVSPESAALNESLAVSISASTSDIYDVKITIQDSGSKEIISEIYNGGWKNPYYYLKGVFPGKSDFSIRATKYSSSAKICTRLRKTNSSSYSEVCKNITLKNYQNNTSSETTPPNTSQNKEVVSISVNNTGSTTAAKSSADFIPQENSESVQGSTDLNGKGVSDKIVLNSPKVSDEVFVTRGEKIRLAAAYGFLILAIIVIVLLALRKL